MDEDVIYRAMNILEFYCHEGDFLAKFSLLYLDLEENEACFQIS